MLRAGSPGGIRYRVGADLVLVSHFLFAAYSVLGGFLLFVDRAWQGIHLPVALWSSAVNLADWTCPLTPLEKRLRQRAGQAGYAGGFVDHYIAPLVYPGGMPRRLELVAGISVLVWNALVYGIAFGLGQAR